jgi:hypothetical protein
MPENSGPQKRKYMDLSPADFEGILTATGAEQQLNGGDTDSGAKSKVCEKLEEKKWIFEKRLDYALEFFKYHAGQRMQMFYYFLLFVGLVVNGYATILRSGDCSLARILSGAGALLTIFFIFLDRRNEELVHISEDVLEHLERDFLFNGYEREISYPRRRGWFGRMDDKNKKEWSLGIFLRQGRDQESRDQGGIERSRYEHGKWLPWFQCSIFVIFVLLAFLSQPRRVVTICHYPIPIGLGSCK